MHVASVPHHAARGAHGPAGKHPARVAHPSAGPHDPFADILAAEDPGTPGDACHAGKKPMDANDPNGDPHAESGKTGAAAAAPDPRLVAALVSVDARHLRSTPDADGTSTEGHAAGTGAAPSLTDGSTVAGTPRPQAPAAALPTAGPATASTEGGKALTANAGKPVTAPVHAAVQSRPGADASAHDQVATPASTPVNKPAAVDTAPGARHVAQAATKPEALQPTARETKAKLAVPPQTSAQKAVAPTPPATAQGNTPQGDSARRPPDPVVTVLPATGAAHGPARSQPSPEPTHPEGTPTQGAEEEGRTRLTEAAQASVNRLTLRQGARGEVDVPDLGRVAVSALSRDGEVDVHLHAARSDTARTLVSHAAEIRADVRAADVTVGRLTFEGGGASGAPQHGSPRGADAQGGGARNPSDRQGSHRGSSHPVDPSERLSSGPGRRVRFVL